MTGLTAGAMRSHCVETDCHVAALLAMTGLGAWWVWMNLPDRFATARRGRARGPGVLGRSCRADLQVPGGGTVETLLREILRLWLRMTCGGRSEAQRGPGVLGRVRYRSCTVGRGSCPRRPPPGISALHPNPPCPQVCHCEPAPALVWQSVPPQAPRLARPVRGAIQARAHDRPHGRCNAFALRGNGLPRRCAPRNDRVGSLVGLDEPAGQICNCPAGASPGAGCVGTELPGRFASARRGHCRNSSARDPSPLAQDDMWGALRRIFCPGSGR